MLIRLLVLLVAANLAWFFWAHSSTPQTEPERLTQQMHPEAVQLHAAPPANAAQPAAIVTRASEPESAPQPAAATASSAFNVPPIILSSPEDAAETPASASQPEPEQEAKPRNVCLQVGAFNEQQIEVLRTRAAALPQGSWSVQDVPLPDRWMVFVPMPDELALLARRAELRAQGIDTDRPGSEHGIGLSLGRYASEERAQRGLAQIVAKGVQDARVVAERQSAAPGRCACPTPRPSCANARSARWALPSLVMNSRNVIDRVSLHRRQHKPANKDSYAQYALNTPFFPVP